MQISLFEDGAPEAAPLQKHTRKSRRAGAFTDNMALPIHRWFRYSAGFSAEWAHNVIQGRRAKHVLDPFAGSGTTLLAAQQAGAKAVGLEAHPFVARIAKAKLTWSAVAPEAFREAARAMLAEAQSAIPPQLTACAPELLTKCYIEASLSDLLRLREALSTMRTSEPVKELLWLTLTSILRECSHVGTAQWQYVLPNKSKVRASDPFRAFTQRVDEFCNDLWLARSAWSGQAGLIQADARSTNVEIAETFDLLVTSPPYPNNYDYADATRLEMSFWGEVSSWGELHGAVRNRLVCSCSQHSSAEKMNLDSLLASPDVDPIRHELTTVCRELERVRETKGGRKTYHTMIASYFLDLALVFKALRPVMEPGSVSYFVIGDSAPYGVYASCDRWLGELALAAGFKSFTFEKLRDRNTKWKNRKHTVPLKEGILMVGG